MGKTVEYWVDTDSGTYGLAACIRFITFDIEEQPELCNAFTDGSDNYRIECALAWGYNPDEQPLRP